MLHVWYMNMCVCAVCPRLGIPLTLSGHELNKGLRGMHWNAYYDSPVPPINQAVRRTIVEVVTWPACSAITSPQDARVTYITLFLDREHPAAGT